MSIFLKDLHFFARRAAFRARVRMMAEDTDRHVAAEKFEALSMSEIAQVLTVDPVDP